MMSRFMLFFLVGSLGFPGLLAQAQGQTEQDVESPAAGKIELDPKLLPYEKVSGISGNLNSIGSDTLNNLMSFWTQSFKDVYPTVRIQVEGKGSGTAPPALIEGTAQLGPMSRPMKESERDEFVKAYGFEPVAIGVALDALAVYVHKDNPLEEMTLPQVDAIFSKNRNAGYPRPIDVWQEVGVKAPWAQRPISLYGRNSASGTYGYFKKVALFKGDFRDTVKEQPGSASVVMGITEDITGVGYSGIGYRTSGVKAVSLAKKEGQKVYPPTYENVLKGKYPLSRMLYVYIAKAPNKPADPLVKEFLTFVLSKEGQVIVIKDGYLPLPAKVAERQLKLLEKTPPKK